MTRWSIRCLMLEGLAAIGSALGDPDDEAAIDRLDAVYCSNRAGRMTAARERAKRG